VTQNSKILTPCARMCQRHLTCDCHESLPSVNSTHLGWGGAITLSATSHGLEHGLDTLFPLNSFGFPLPFVWVGAHWNYHGDDDGDGGSMPHGLVQWKFDLTSLRPISQIGQMQTYSQCATEQTWEKGCQHELGGDECPRRSAEPAKPCNVWMISPRRHLGTYQLSHYDFT